MIHSVQHPFLNTTEALGIIEALDATGCTSHVLIRFYHPIVQYTICVVLTYVIGAMACVRTIYGLLLSCSVMDNGMVGMMTMHTTADCWASNEPYLTTLAYCMQVKCEKDEIKASKLEWFWENESTGQSNAGQSLATPKWTYSETLAKMTGPPTNQLNSTDKWLNVTSLVPEDVYTEQWNVLVAVDQEFARENAYG
jgi:hypothetical protein